MTGAHRVGRGGSSPNLNPISRAANRTLAIRSVSRPQLNISVFILSCVCCCNFSLQAVNLTETVENGHSKARSKTSSTFAIFLHQSMALLQKRLFTFRRDKKMWIFVVFMPLLFVGSGALIVLSLERNDQPSLTLSPQVRYLWYIDIATRSTISSVSAFLFQGSTARILASSVLGTTAAASAIRRLRRISGESVEHSCWFSVALQYQYSTQYSCTEYLPTSAHRSLCANSTSPRTAMVALPYRRSV